MSRQLPTLLVLTVAGVGMVLGAAGTWRVGATVVGLSLLLAGGLRLALPTRQAGALAVRTRPLDAALLLALGLAIVLLAHSIPDV